jgi:hypothetical protein
MAGMRVSPWIVGAVLAVMLPTWSWARLGETPEQCEARYGAPIEVTNTRMPYASVTIITYGKDDVFIMAVFHRGNAQHISFRKQTPLSQAELNALLKANGEGRPWKLNYSDPNNGWLKENNFASATFDMRENSVIFTSNTFAALQDSVERIGPSGVLEGF